MVEYDKVGRVAASLSSSHRLMGHTNQWSTKATRVWLRHRVKILHKLIFSSFSGYQVWWNMSYTHAPLDITTYTDQVVYILKSL